MNLAWLWSRARLAINKKKQIFSLPDHQLAENQILLVCKKGQKEDKNKFVSNSVWISYDYFHVKKSLKLLVKTFATVFFHWSLESQNCKKNKLKNALSKSSPAMDTLVGKLSKRCNCFWGFQEFLIYLAKYFWSLLSSADLITQQCFAIAIRIKQFNFFSFVKV